MKPESTLEALDAAGESLALPDDVAQAVRELLDAGTARATLRAYEGDARYFEAWRHARGLGYGMPVPVATVITFLTDHLGELPDDVDHHLVELRLKARLGPHKLSTIRRRLASISSLHQLAGLESPTHDARFRKLLSKAGKATAAAGERPTKKKAATKDLLMAMVETCDSDLQGIRDRALLLVGAASGGRRRSEIAGLQLADLEEIPGGWTYRLRRSKTDQAGTDGRVYPILGRAAAALDAWLDASGLKAGAEGTIFRAITRHGHISDRPMAGRSVADIIKRRAWLAGLDPRAFGGHSLRSGFVTQAGRAGVAKGDAMALSGHRSEAVAGGYYEAGAVTNNPAARVFDEG